MRPSDIEQAAPALDHRAFDLLRSGDGSWSFALERIRVAGERLPIALDRSTLHFITQWARQSRPAADVAERWAVKVGEVVAEWIDDVSVDEDPDVVDLLDALSDIEDISDYWDVEHPAP